MKTSVILALFGFVLAVGFSVALTENELAEIADEFEEENLRGQVASKKYLEMAVPPKTIH